MKQYTDIEQSRKLAEILPLESADMKFYYNHMICDYEERPYVGSRNYDECSAIPCWSLAALLSVINKTYYVTLLHDGIMWNILVIHHDIDKCNHTIHADSPVDACYEMILKLNELNLL